MGSILPNLYRFDDTCNVYVLTHGDRALLIDCGGGDVTSHLDAAGIKHIDWVLFTHHHRDQCFGAAEFIRQGAKLAVPAHERFLFERASDYWQQKRIYDNYNDRNTFFTISENLPVAASLEDYETFEWGPYTFKVLPTPGHTLGSITLIAEIGGTRVAFTGDLMHDGGKLYQLHAMEYDYGDLVGANWVAQSIDALKKQDIAMALPSHGPIVREPAACFTLLDGRLHELMTLQRDRLGQRFIHEIRMEQISEHLLWGTDATCSNFYVVRADNGKALFIDYPYGSMDVFRPALHSEEPFATLRFVEHHLDELREQWGITSFDVVIATHIHDDHTCGIPYLQRHHGTRCWAQEDVAKVLESPADWNTPCLLPAPIRIDRRFGDGEKVNWEGFDLEIVFYPGQTEFHSAILGEIDGKRVLFSGDSSYPLWRYLPDRKDLWMVNTVMRNSLTLAMHRKCADEFDRLRGELLCPGHGPVLDIEPEAYDQHRHYVEQKEQLWRDLLPEPADMGIDLFWARLIPYQRTIAPGASCRYTLELRNSFGEDVTFAARLTCTSLAIEVAPAERSLSLAAEQRGEVTFDLSVSPDAPADAPARHLVTAHVTVNGKPHGPITEALIVVDQ